MKVLVLLALLGTCAAQYYNSFVPSNGYNTPSNSYNAPSSGFSSGGGSRGNSGFSGSGLSYLGGGSNSGFTSSRGGSLEFSIGNSGFGGFGFSNGNGASGFESSRSYGPVIHVGGNQNSGYAGNSGSSGFGGGSSFIAADNGFNSGNGGNSGCSGTISGTTYSDNGYPTGYLKGRISDDEGFVGNCSGFVTGYISTNNGNEYYDFSYARIISLGGGYGSNSGSTGFGGGSSFIAANNGFNSGNGGNIDCSGVMGGITLTDNGFQSGNLYADIIPVGGVPPNVGNCLGSVSGLITPDHGKELGRFFITLPDSPGRGSGSREW